MKTASLFQRWDAGGKGGMASGYSKDEYYHRIGHSRKAVHGSRYTHVVRSLDDMAEREMAKRKQQSKYSASQKEFEELVKAIPDPAREQDGLLADGTLSLHWSVE